MKNYDDVLRSRHAAGLPDAIPAPASDTFHRQDAARADFPHAPMRDRTRRGV
ncbi:hypothetical protein [Sphingopyxis terrae]|uniref:hypothetical protein n=1 Tax=Sphingopyxis terrae TaxID=33052 RepID=UPI003643320C